MNFNQAMGRTLEVQHITVADATRGKMTKDPQIPGTPDPERWWARSKGAAGCRADSVAASRPERVRQQSASAASLGIVMRAVSACCRLPFALP